MPNVNNSTIILETWEKEYSSVPPMRSCEYWGELQRRKCFGAGIGRCMAVVDGSPRREEGC